MASYPRSPRLVVRRLILILAALLALCGGPIACRPPAADSSASRSASGDPAARDPASGKSPAAKAGSDSAGGSPGATAADRVLREMLQAYAGASAYRDQGVIRLHYRQRGELHLDEAPLSVQWKKPDQLRLAAYQLELATDGSQFRARVTDAASNNLDQQMVVREAPATLGLRELYSDPVVHDVLQSGLGRYPIQLELLLAEKPLEAFLDPQVGRSLLDEQSIDQRACHRVRIETEEGAFVLWVDRQSHELLRMEYPASLVQQMVAPDDSVDQVRLVAELRNARLGESPDPAAFSLDVPPSARQVRAFVLPPEPLPTDLYGRRPATFFFTDLEGGRRTQQDLTGNVAVLAWFTNHPACRPALEALHALRAKLPAESGVTILAVSTEPSRVSDQALRDLLAEWKVELPLVRDLEAFGRDVFRIPGAPTIVVLDAEGQVQSFEVGTDPEATLRMTELLRQLREGQDPAAQLLAAYRTERENYQRLVEAGGEGETAVLDVPPTPLRPASQPQRLQLTQLWQCESFQAAGNLLALTGPGDPAETAPSLLAFDGFQTVVQVSLEGEIQQRTRLEIPQDFAATYLRSATDAQGKRYFAASALRGQQVFLFDQDWKRLASYPPDDQPHDGIHDCLLIDLDADGSLELGVGFWGLIGVHVVDLEGNRLWSNRAATNVLTLAGSFARSGQPRELLASSDLGPIFRFDRLGRQDTPIRIADRAVHHLYCHPLVVAGSPASASAGNPTQVPYCGLSYQGPGQMLALGLDDQFTERWSYTLPGGTYQTEVQFVTPLTLPGGEPAWALVGPDGSVHIVGSNGQFHDHFGVGAAVTGIAAVEWQGKQILVVATSERLTAWSISL